MKGSKRNTIHSQIFEKAVNLGPYSMHPLKIAIKCYAKQEIESHILYQHRRNEWMNALQKDKY